MDQNASGETIQEPEEAVIHYWIEKTIVSGRPDRQDGEHALGKALWSPQRAKDGKDIYKAMRAVKPNDVILHLVDNKGISAVSTVGSSLDDSFVGLESTDWAGQKGYRIQLNNYTRLDPLLDRSWFLGNQKYAARLLALLERGHSLFYSRELVLNQGGYLTEAPPELINILNEVYTDRTGKNLPHIAQQQVILNAKDVQLDNILPAFVSALSDAGIRVAFDTVIRLLSGLLAKPFLIMTGLSGSGKKRLLMRWLRG